MNPAAPALDAPLTMSTREIAELTGKEHKHVIRDTREMLDQLGDGPNLDHVREEKDARGYTACFHLPKDLTLTLVAGYSVPLRHKIVVRWMELEARLRAPALPNFADPAEAAARAWAVEYEARQALALEAWESLSFS